ncbi:MAG: hypothetical protein EA417_22735 [Gammaproteobacteria bacterium]|nr:MAG: hypothetical protein EA417_22735 [Gammaproteobacteria bacterium]
MKHLIVGLFAVLSGWPIASFAEPEERDTEKRQADQEALMDLYCRDGEQRPESWLDRSHSYISERLCEPAAWFDGFFGDSRSFEETPVGTFIRIRNAAEWDQDGGVGYGLRIRASIVLPRLSDQFRLLVTRDEDISGDIRDDTALGDGSDRTRLGLRFIASERSRSQLDFDGSIGVDGGGLNPEVRGRYRYVQGLTDRTLARATQTVFWQRSDGFGTTSRLDWEWLRSRDELLRWTGQGTVSEGSDGVDWQTSVIAFRQLNSKSALRGELGTFGYTKPRFEVEEYFLAVRYRRQFLRRWLYYELQPEHAWPLDSETGSRRSDWRFSLTLEVQFENETSRHQRLRDYLGEEADVDEWGKEMPIPAEAPGRRAHDSVLDEPDDETGG